MTKAPFIIFQGCNASNMFLCLFVFDHGFQNYQALGGQTDGERHALAICDSAETLFADDSTPQPLLIFVWLQQNPSLAALLVQNNNPWHWTRDEAQSGPFPPPPKWTMRLTRSTASEPASWITHTGWLCKLPPPYPRSGFDLVTVKIHCTWPVTTRWKPQCSFQAWIGENCCTCIIQVLVPNRISQIRSEPENCLEQIQ